MDNLLKEYAERFNEAFPVFVFPGDENDMIKVIEECLKNNIPYKPNYDKTVLY